MWPKSSLSLTIKNRSRDLAVDTFLYYNPLATVLFAAGNDGVYGSATTVLSPSQGKNVLTVGASEVVIVKIQIKYIPIPSPLC